MRWIPPFSETWPSSVIERERFEAAGHSGKAFGERARPDVQGTRVNASDRFERVEVRKLRSAGFQQIQVAFEAEGDHHGGPKGGNALSPYQSSRHPD